MFKITNWRTRSVGMVLSLLLHALALLFLLPPSISKSTSDKNSGAVDGDDVVFIDPSIHYNLAETNKTTELFKEAIEQRDLCKDASANFVGLGIRWYPATGIVTHVAKGYAAQKAGLLVGDRIINTESLAGDFADKDVGKLVTLHIERYNVRLRISVRLEKVCFLRQPHVEASES